MDLYGLQEDSMEAAKLGASVLLGASVAQKVVTLDAIKDVAGGYVAPLVPIAVGIAIHSYGKAQFPIAAPGVAAGMVAVGVGKLLGKAVAQFAPTQSATVKDFVAFAGLGADTYDTGLLGGFGYSYGAGVDRYMMAGAPTQVQSLMGAPLQVQSLSGLGSTIVGGSAPLSASLM